MYIHMQMLIWIIVLVCLLLILLSQTDVIEPFNNMCDSRMLNKKFNNTFLVTKNLMMKDGNIKGVLYKKYKPYLGMLNTKTFNREFVYKPLPPKDLDFVYRDEEYDVLYNMPYDDPEVADRIPLPYYKDWNL
jgi:hypothetical protein